MTEAFDISSEHYSGCMLGGAIGDALGASVEFLSIRQIREKFGPEGITHYVEHPDGSGEFTDDTQMTLFTAEGLLRSWHRAAIQGIGGSHILLTYHSYLRWLHTQGELNPKDIGQKWHFNPNSGWLIKHKDLFHRRAPGNACLSSLLSGKIGSIKIPINHSKGCGGVMRMAPAGLVFDTPAKAFQVGCELAAITHGHPSGYLSAGTLAAIIQQLADKKSLEEAISASLILLCKETGHNETLDTINYAVEWYEQTKSAVANGTVDFATLIARLGGGWVGEEALAIALFCALHFRDNFRKGVLASVNHSGDSDSTGSITGNLLGLINGESNIPMEWILHLKSAEIVKQVGEDLFIGCKSEAGHPDREWWLKYPGS
jgi:ADP-ribosylglycohydrolase